MKTRLKLKPGQRGTKKLVEQYGDRLLCVRYRYDEAQQKRFKTIELIVDEVAWKPTLKPDTFVDLRVGWGEANLADKIKYAGGRWDGVNKVWVLRYDLAVKLGLQARIVGRHRI
jgi:hypothetical protein